MKKYLALMIFILTATTVCFGYVASDTDESRTLNTHQIYNSESGATGGGLEIIHDSASPADNDELGDIKFIGLDSGNAETNYFRVYAESADVTNATEDGVLIFEGQNAGSATELFKLDTNVNISDDIPMIHSGMTIIRDVVELADDAVVTLNSAVTGVLEIWVEGDDEYALVHVTDAAVVTSCVTAKGSVAYTDSDTNLSIYDGGTSAIIKNRLGATKNISYEFKFK